MANISLAQKDCRGQRKTLTLSEVTVAWVNRLKNTPSIDLIYLDEKTVATNTSLLPTLF